MEACHSSHAVVLGKPESDRSTATICIQAARGMSSLKTSSFTEWTGTVFRKVYKYNSQFELHS